MTVMYRLGNGDESKYDFASRSTVAKQSQAIFVLVQTKIYRDC